MIAPDIRFEQLDPRHMSNLLRLMNPPPGRDPVPRGGERDSDRSGVFERLAGGRRGGRAVSISIGASF